VQQIVDEARGRADLGRDEAFETARRAAEAEAAGIVAEGERRSAAIRAAGEERLPGLVDDVIALVAGGDS
jgi:vacuolar-type H+-ATPase subunit H